MKQLFIMAHDTARANAVEAVRNAPSGYRVEIKPPTRSLEQNSALWGILQAFADQLTWPVNGQMVKLSPEEWKTITTAAFRKESGRVAMGLDGGVVMLGMRTSKMTKEQFSEYLEFLHAVAADRGVVVYPEGVSA